MDSLGTCNLEEDQVRLLSVLAQNSFSVSDDSSDDSDCGGRDNQLMASSEDESSSDSEAEDKIPAKYSAILKQAHVLNNSASSEEVITPCDPHASEPIINNNNNNDLPSFNNAENLIASKDQDGNSPNDPSINDPTSAVVQDKMEWVFTLYDFDGKGSLTKEDIGSLARSIYDVLGNAKVPL
uniref:Protein naked cuticle homolog n=1 Tax=Plectus sambesii TaxID=2011161 RepID=A0A914VGB7_9BILA